MSTAIVIALNIGLSLPNANIERRNKMGMDIWTLLVVGQLLYPVEFHSEQSCRIAAIKISERLQATTLCVNPHTGELAEYSNGTLEFEQIDEPNSDNE